MASVTHKPGLVLQVRFSKFLVDIKTPCKDSSS